jgi:hypothetical protein
LVEYSEQYLFYGPHPLSAEKRTETVNADAQWTREAERSRDWRSGTRPTRRNLLMRRLTNSGAPTMACSTDKFAATYVVAPDLGPPDCKVADFTDIQNAVDALPPTGGKIFVKAGAKRRNYARRPDL